MLRKKELYIHNIAEPQELYYFKNGCHLIKYYFKKPQFKHYYLKITGIFWVE